MFRFKQWVCVFSLLWSTWACAVDVPAPKITQLTPVSVSDLKLTTKLALDRLKVGMLEGDEYGHTSFGMFCVNSQTRRIDETFIKNYGTYEVSVGTQVLKKYGYPIASMGNAGAFGTDVSAAPDFRIGGILKEVRVETCMTGDESEGWVYLKIDWALYSEKTQRVVLQQTTEGLVRSEKKIAGMWRAAFTSAFENFLAAPEFLDILKASSTAVAGDAGSEAGVAKTNASESAAAVVSKVQDKVAPATAGKAPQAPSVTQKTALPGGGSALGVVVAVEPLKISLLPGDEFGHASGGMFCSNPQPLAAYDGFIKRWGTFAASIVSQSLKKNGYPLASLRQTSAFDTDQSEAPDFKLGGVLKDLRMEICRGGRESEGWVYNSMEWALYSTKEKRVVFQFSTEGVAKSANKIPNLEELAITSAVDNLLANPDFLAALKAGTKSAVPAEVAGQAPAANGVAGTDAGAASRQLAIKGGVADAGGAQKNQAKLRAAVVTLETAKGSGSGFYIDREGYLLTSFHVVKGSKYVKVKLQNGDKLVAELVKFSERDDVALLK